MERRRQAGGVKLMILDADPGPNSLIALRVSSVAVADKASVGTRWRHTRTRSHTHTRMYIRAHPLANDPGRDQIRLICLLIRESHQKQLHPIMTWAELDWSETRLNWTVELDSVQNQPP